MLRWVANRLAGRRKTIDEQVENTYRAVSIIGSLPADFSIGIATRDIATNHASPKEVIDYLRETLRDTAGYANTGSHTVYVGETDEKHYMALSSSRVIGVFGGEKYLDQPHNRVELEFVVKK